jgi:hypothetical protein
MPRVKNFSENLEKHLNRLGQETAKLKELPGNKSLPERELLKQSLKSFSQDESTDVSDNPGQAASAERTGVKSEFLPDYLSGDPDSEAKKVVERLILSAMNDDLAGAIIQAKKYPPFVEDAFHDALVDKLLPELKKRKAV